MKATSKILLLAILALLVLAAPRSYAVTPPGLIISDGTNTVTIDQGGNVTFSSPCQNCSTIVISAKPGQLVWIGNIGTFSEVTASGTSKPLLTGAPQQDLSVSAVASTGGTLTFMWSDVGWTESDIVNLVLTAGGTITGSGTAGYSAYSDNTNTPFGQGVLGGTLGPFTGPAYSGGPLTGPGPTAAPFSMTNSVTLSLGPSAQGGGDFFLQALPSQLGLTCPTSTGQESAAYSSSLNGNGGIPPYTYAIISGTLPDALNVDTAGGGIIGTPDQSGTSTFTAQVTDSNVPSSTVSLQCSITIQPPTQLYEISGYTYSDNNVPPNMIFDNPPDAPIGNVTVTLAACSAPGTVIASTSTSSSGYYQFPSLQAGCYQVSAPSSANSENLETAPTLTANIGPNSDNNNFGYIQTGQISGYTYSDNNENQIYDSPDTPIPSVTVTLTDCSGAPITGQPPIQTNNNGYYNFSNLPAGCYKVSAPSSAGGESADTPSTISVTLPAGGNSQNNNFGYTPPAVTGTCVSITGEQGVAITPVTLTGSGGAGGPYTFSATGLPTGLSISSSGTISGMPTQSGTFNYTVIVTDKDGNHGTIQCSVTINLPLSVTCGTNTVGEVGVAFNSGPMTVTGGTAPYTYSIVGTLPTGLSLNTSNGAITGTATSSGTFTVKVTDANGATSTSCAITISPALAVTCGTNTVGEVGVAFNSGPMTVTGGTAPYTYSIVGTLPTGLSLNTSNGAITGTATSSGTFTVKVTDANGATSTSCTITISPALAVTCGTNTVGEVGVAFNSGPMTVTGGTAPYTYSIVGTLPTGLSLNTSNGAITGTPTSAGSFTVKVTDANGATSTSCAITISPALSVTCGTNTVGEVGVAFNSGPMTVTGGTAPYTYSIVGTLPTGLSLNTTNGAITGTPTSAGSFTVKVTDANGATSTSCNITISPALAVTCGTNTVGEVGVAFNSGPMTVTGGTAPYTYSIVGTLPTGLSLNTTNGAITGTPTSAGSFTVKVTDAKGATSTSCTITINPALSVTCGTNNVGMVGVAFNSGPMTVTGGTAPYTYSIVGTLPTGLSLNTSNGAITGTPTAAGSFTVKVTDAKGATSTSCTITIGAAVGSVEGTVWNDQNADDIQDNGEPGLANVTVQLENSSGTVIATLTTNSSGFYNFTNITPGNYTVCVDQSTVPVGYVETYDSDGLATPNCASGTVPVGQEIALNFGYFKPACQATTSVNSNFNGTRISGGNYLWLTLHLKASGLPNQITTVRFDNGTAQLSVNGSPVNLTLPSGIIIFNPNVTTSTLNYNAASNTYTITVPRSESGNVFLTGLPYPVPSGGWPGGIQNIKVTGRMSSDATGVSTQWQWAAAVYTQFSTNPSALGIKPVDDNSTSQYHNADLAGTPENYKQYVTGGGCGGGGSNYTGSNSGTASTSCQTGNGCPHHTYTCNGWNASSCNGNPGAILQKNFNKCYSNGNVSIGGYGGYSLTFTNATAAGTFVLQGGSPWTLTSSATNPNSSSAGVFAGDVLALRLNIDFSNTGITEAGFANRVVTTGPLHGYTVAQVMTLANQVLSGQTWNLPWGMQVSDLDNVVSNINSNYENGAIDNGYLR